LSKNYSGIMAPKRVDIAFFSWSVILGGLIGLGQILDSSERLSWRIVVGRALVSAGLASMAPVLLVWLPGMPRTAEFAAAAVLASAGTSGLQMLVRRLLTGKAN
jgi:hypothetical protein